MYVLGRPRSPSGLTLDGAPFSGERIAAVVVFLVIWVPVGIFGYRLGQRLSER